MTQATVVVPAFARPELLERCLRALAAQRLPPLEVVVAVRSGDDASLAAVERATPALGERVRSVTVTAAGHLPPLRAGVAAARADVVAFVDDDAEPWPAWLDCLLRHYRDPTVGGVGGLVAQPGADERRVADAVARVRWNGRFDALALQYVPAAWGPRDAHALRGTNMSFRRELLLRYPWDGRLNRGAATDYEVDLTAWIRRQGYRLVYDPDAVVTHHLAPRPEIGRAASPERIADYSHNLVYVSGKALPRPSAALAIARSLVVGSRASHGLVTAAVDALRGSPPSLRGELLPALGGKIAGLRSLREHRRSGPAPLDGAAE